MRGNTALRLTFAQPVFPPVREIARNMHAAPSEVGYGRTNGFYHVPPLAWDQMPDISEYERWFYNFGPYRKCVSVFSFSTFLLVGY